jgi:hypothetical protein
MQKNDDYKFAPSLGLLDMDPTVLSSMFLDLRFSEYLSLDVKLIIRSFHVVHATPMPCFTVEEKRGELSNSSMIYSTIKLRVQLSRRVHQIVCVMIPKRI